MMKLFKANDDLCQNFGGFVECEYSVFKFSLIVDEVSSIAVLQNKVDVSFVLGYVIELDDICRIHGLHAFDLSIQVLT